MDEPAVDELDLSQIRERVEAYVLSMGFTAEDIAKLRELLLEPMPVR